MQARYQTSPHAIDVCFLPEVRALTDVAIDGFDITSFTEILASLIPAVCDLWRETIKTRLTMYTSNHIGCSADVDPFALACAIFRCSVCSSAPPYPAALAHGCLNQDILDGYSVPSKKHGKGKNRPPTYEEIATKAYSCRPLSIEILDLDRWSERIYSVIWLYGQDPKSATSKEMDDAALVTTQCPTMIG